MNVVTIYKTIDQDNFFDPFNFTYIWQNEARPDNYENFVKIQIFLQFTLVSVKV